MQTVHTAPTAGKPRKDAAHEMLDRRYERQLLAARRALLTALLSKETASADDIQSALRLADGVSAVYLGAAPKPLARAGIIRRDGYVTSSRPQAHARPVSAWRLVDRAAAERWLREHPAPAEQTAALVSIATRQPSLPGVGDAP